MLLYHYFSASLHPPEQFSVRHGYTPCRRESHPPQWKMERHSRAPFPPLFASRAVPAHTNQANRIRTCYYWIIQRRCGCFRQIKTNKWWPISRDGVGCGYHLDPHRSGLTALSPNLRYTGSELLWDLDWWVYVTNSRQLDLLRCRSNFTMSSEMRFLPRKCAMWDMDCVFESFEVNRHWPGKWYM